MTDKERYAQFSQSTYVPIYSKPWWMDAVCEPENWDVWLYESGGEILAAMPYYMEQRGSYRYITKAPLTQNNGIIFKETDQTKQAAIAEKQEKIINAACQYIQELNVDVYEQQYPVSFTNWQPFYWNNYTNLLRYTYVLNTEDMQKVNDGITKNYRSKIRKGQKMTTIVTDLTMDEFYKLHEQVFLRQGLSCPFSYELWKRLYVACAQHNACQIFGAKDVQGNVCALLFLVWDERSAYQLLGGYMEDYANLQGHPALIYHAIEFASQRGLKYDFEGSMIQRIAKARRQFGGTPMPYFRIRKVFNPEIVRKEAEDYIQRVQRENLQSC